MRSAITWQYSCFSTRSHFSPLKVSLASSIATLASVKPRNRFPRSISELVTSQLVPGDMAKSSAITTNMGVDYVIVFRFGKTGKHMRL